MTGSRVVRLLMLALVVVFVVAVTDNAVGNAAIAAKQKGKGGGNGGGGGGGNPGVAVDLDDRFDIRSGHVLDGDVDDGQAAGPRLEFATGKNETIIFDFGSAGGSCINWLVANGVLTGASNMVEIGGKVGVRTHDGTTPHNGSLWMEMTTSPVDVRAKFTIYGKKRDPQWLIRFYPDYVNAPNNGSDLLTAWRNGDGTWTIVSGTDAGGNIVAATAFVYINGEATTNSALCEVSLNWTATLQ